MIDSKCSDVQLKFYKNLRSWNFFLTSSTTLDSVIINPLDNGSNGKSGDHLVVIAVLLLWLSLDDWSTDDFSNDSKRSTILYYRLRVIEMTLVLRI